MKPTINLLKQILQKKAFTVVDKPDNILASAGKLVSDTYGRLGAIPSAALVGQEKFLDHLKGPDKELIEKSLEKSKSDERLKDVIVRLNHFDPVQDVERAINNEGIVSKTLGTLALPPAWVAQLTSRADNYNPVTNTVHLYSGIPEVAHHELGHAKDFNINKNTRENKLITKVLEGMVLGKIAPAIRAGPITQLHETNANTEAEKTYTGDMKEFRRRLWPARATYIGAGLSGLAATIPGVREKYMKLFQNVMPILKPTDNKIIRKLKLMAPALAIPALSAAGGRLAAETVNLFKSDQDPNNDSIKKGAASPAWQRSAGKNPEGGLNAKGRASYKRETGGTLKAPVTESNPSGERAKRQNSFCSRMCGMKRVNTGAAAKSDPDSRINKSLRKWNCKCGEAHNNILAKIGCLLKK